MVRYEVEMIDMFICGCWVVIFFLVLLFVFNYILELNNLDFFGGLSKCNIILMMVLFWESLVFIVEEGNL